MRPYAVTLTLTESSNGRVKLLVQVGYRNGKVGGFRPFLEREYNGMDIPELVDDPQHLFNVLGYRCFMIAHDCKAM